MPSRTDEGAPIIGLTYDLCASLYEHVDRFPRAQRTLLGRLALDEGLRLLAALTLANRLTAKRDTLQEASGHLDALRIALRLSKRLGFLPNRGYEALARTADEVGRMLGGWLRYERGRGAPGGAGSGPEPTPSPPPTRAAAGGMEQRSGKGGVRYTMRSPVVERYLAAKLEHPTQLVLVESGASYEAFFEDAQLLGRELGLQVVDASADSEREKIFTCAIPKTQLEGSVELLGREMHVERVGGPTRSPDPWR